MYKYLYLYYTHVIYSKSLVRYYIGESEDPYMRLKLHNSHHFKKGFTKAADDWEMAIDFRCKSSKNNRRKPPQQLL